MTDEEKAMMDDELGKRLLEVKDIVNSLMEHAKNWAKESGEYEWHENDFFTFFDEEFGSYQQYETDLLGEAADTKQRILFAESFVFELLVKLIRWQVDANSGQFVGEELASAPCQQATTYFARFGVPSIRRDLIDKIANGEHIDKIAKEDELSWKNAEAAYSLIYHSSLELRVPLANVLLYEFTDMQVGPYAYGEKVM
jgi:hypothetical protein